MATVEGLKPLGSGSIAPEDPNVRVPDHVRRAAERAAEIHNQAYTPEAQPQPVPEVPSPPLQPEAQPQPEPHQPSPPLQPEAQPQEFPAPKPGEENVSAEEWRHRFLSMQGRYNAQVRTTASMEEQMRQLGEELVRTQNLIQQPAPASAQPAPRDHGNLITDEDRANYGDELIDLASRAARAAVTPELEQLRAENQRLTQRVTHTGKKELFSVLDRGLPNWRQINTSVQFKAWLRLPNVYTGQVRQQMLNAAVNGAEAPKVLALFKDFLAEAAATGQTAPAPQIEQPQPLPAPRTPAVDLETLAAPGRARPASGDSQVPVEKPIYSRAQISKFYDDKRRGFYAGRDAEVAAFEADLTVAQREGRIRG